MLKQLQTKQGTLLNHVHESSATTTDATVTTIETLTLGANSAGVLKVTAVGVNAANGDAITGSQIVRFKKTSGTLTLGTPADLLAVVADTGLSGGTIAIAASANNIIVTVKGKASVTVKWKCILELLQ